ncbi:MAG TPA: MFS transporter [Ktedonobacteraceae bacterium]|jgi:MFS family permease|nr:MFS transporter [Ktedonobacteraceae bacterium]
MAVSSSEHSAESPKMLPVLFASTVGTSIEWYDFFLFNLLSASVFARLFFPTFSPVAGTILAFTTNFVGFAARPIGGAFFGWFGDRVGRKSTLIVTLLLMGIATFLMGCMPTYVQIGVWAPILISVLRFLQGAGVGGEWGGSVLLSMEYGDSRRRGFWSSWPQTGVPIGLALAAIAIIICQNIFPGDSFLAIGWRIPFFFSALLILMGLYIRLRILETPRFARLKAENRISRSPLTEVFKHHWREIALTALLRSGEQAPFYIFSSYILTYGKGLGIASPTLYTGIIIGSIIAFIAMPSFSALSDRVGRKRLFMSGVIVMAIAIVPYFLLLNTKIATVVIIGIALSIGLCHAWLYGIEASLISEHFGTKLRYTGASLGYQFASITAGGPAPIIAVALFAAYKSFVPIAIYMIIMCVISLLALLGLREYANKEAAADIDAAEAMPVVSNA